MVKIYKSEKCYTILIALAVFFAFFSNNSAFGQCGTTYSTNTTVSAAQTISTPCTLTVNTGVTLTLSGGVTINSGGTFVILGSGTVNFTDNSTLNLTLNTGGTFSTAATTTFTNQGIALHGGTFSVATGVTATTTGNNGVIDGPVIITGGGTLSAGNVAIQSPAAAEVQNNTTLTLSSNVNMTSGQITVDAGGTLNLNFSGDNNGVNIIDNGTLALGNSYNANGGIISGTGIFNTNGNSVQDNSGEGTIFGINCNGNCPANMFCLGRPVTITPSTPVICSASAVTLSASATGTGYTYVWKYNSSGTPSTTEGGNTSTLSTSTVGAGNAGAGNYNVSVSCTSCSPSGGACSAVTSQTIAVTTGTTPAAPASISPTTAVCNGSLVTYTAATVTGATSYAWTITGGSGTSTTTSDAVTWNTAGNETVAVAAVSAGCTSTVFSQGITVNPSTGAAVSIAALPSGAICSGTSVTFTATPTNGGTTPAYQWKVNGVNAGTNSPTFTSTTLANGNTVTCTMTPTCGTAATSATTTMTVNTTPTAPTSISPITAACNGSTVTYTESGGTGTTYAWTITGGTSAGSTTSSNGVTWTATGTENVSVIAIASGCSSSVFSQNITVNAIPTAPTSISPTATACNGSTVTYTEAGGAGTSYAWTITGGSGTSTTTSDAVTWNTAGTETVAVAAVANGCTSAVHSQNITVTALPTAPTSISPITSTCNGSVVTYTESGGTGTTYAWTITGGTSAGSTTSSNGVTWTATGTENVSVVAIASGCTSAVFSQNITVNAIPTAPTSISPTATVCNGSTVTYTEAGGAGTTYAWTITGGSGASTTTSDVVTWSTAGTETVAVAAVANGCTSAVHSQSITVTALPTAPTSISPTSAICNGSIVTYTESGGGGTTYAWTITGGTSAGSTTSSDGVTWTTAGTENVSVVAIASGCTSAVFSQNITVNPFPSAAGTITGSANVCEGQTSIAYSIPAVANATSYSWVLPANAFIASGTNTNSITVGYTTSTTSGNVQVTPTNSCGSGTSSTLAVTVNATPVITSTPTTVCPGVSVTFNITSPAGTGTYTWLKNAVSTGSTGNSLTVPSPTAAASYTATFTNGCTTPASNAIVVNTLPSAAGAITGSTTVCEGQTGITYSIAAVSNATSYTWTLPSTAFIFSGTNTNSIVVNYTTASASGNVQVTPIGACGNGTPSTLAVTVVTPPTSITPTTTAALGSTVTYTASAVTGATSYAWTITGGTGTSTTNTDAVTWNTAGTETVAVAAVASGCTTAVTSQNITVASAVSWTGTTNTDWATATNWNPAFVPTSSLTATIPNVTNKPIISSSTTAAVSDITINASSSLTLNSGSALNLFGNFTNNGTITDNGGTTTFEGAAAQTYVGPAGGTSLSSLTLSNSNGLTLSNPVTVNKTLTLTSGPLTSNGKLTINLYTGGISGAGSGTVVGNITVNKRVDTAGYHYIAAPLFPSTAADLSNIGVNTTTFYNLYWYDETNTSPADSIGWTAVTSSGFTLNAMQGYAYYFFAAPETLSYTKTYTHNASYSIGLTSTLSGTAAADGWNLVGNPYPSSVDWNASSGWTKTGIDNAVYFYNPAIHNYASYVSGAGTNGGTNVIPSMQGFWVHVTTDGGSGALGANNSVRSSAAAPLLWRTGIKMNYMNITATGPDSVIDESVIRLLPDATNSYDVNDDAYKLMGDAGYPNLFTTIGGIQYSVNTLPEALSDYTVPLNFVANTNGTFNFTVNDAASFQNYQVTLIDNLTNTQQDLKTVPNYSFSAVEGDTNVRFYINFRNESTLGITSLIANKTGDSSTVVISNNNSGVIVDFFNTISHSADLTLYNILGENIWETKNADIRSGSYTINANAFPSGIYILKVIIDSKIYSKKIYLVK